MITKIGFLCLIILLLLLYLCNNDNIVDYFSNLYIKPEKTVILVFSINHKGGYYLGLGDMIRAMIKVFQICKKFNYEYIIDIQLHPMSQFFKKVYHKYENYIIANSDNIHYKENPEQYIKTCNSKTVFFTSNDTIDYNSPITDECKNYVKKILTPNDELQKYINNINNSIPYNPYNILHYRIGDEYILNNEEINISPFLDSFNSHIRNNDILMSDTMIFKNQMKKIHKKIFTFDFEVGHVGYEKNTEKIKNTLCEFFIMTKAKSIKTYSTYPWVSNFVMIIGKLYDIPIPI